MKFTILSHAGIALEHGGIRLVCDPWLIGSCYWRSWWNFPEPPRDLIGDLRPHYIYLTHLHWDHFHGPSLQRLFDRSTTILIPKVPTRRMLNDLYWLGFKDVREIPHGTGFQLGPNFALRSYQFGPAVDSAAVVSGGGHTVFNCNDAKFFGLPLRQIMRDFPKIDFILRSHSSASPVPYCVVNYETLLPPDSGAYDSANQFVQCALYVGARYAIPFASNHCFLHKETRQFNSNATTPEQVRRHYERVAAERDQGGECVVMPPGSSWSDGEGFSIVPFDFAQRASYIESLHARHQDRLEATYQEEAEAKADFSAFRGYFEHLLRSIPALARRCWLSPIAFRTEDRDGQHQWLVNPSDSTITEIDSVPEGCVLFEVHPKVLNDCATKRMFSVWSASKRLRIHLPSAAQVSTAARWFTVLDLYEVEMLPLRRNFSLRALAVRLRRWREVVEVLRILGERVFLGRRFDIAALYATTARAPRAGGA